MKTRFDGKLWIGAFGLALEVKDMETAHLLNTGYAGHVLLEDALDTHGQGERAHGATGASALQLQLDHTFVVDANIAHVAAVSLEVGADLLEHLKKELFVNSHGGSLHTYRIVAMPRRIGAGPQMLK